MHFSLVKFQLEHDRWANALDDVILPLYFALTRLGYRAETRLNSINPDSVNILFGLDRAPQLLEPEPPANSIVFNLELHSGSELSTPDGEYAQILQRFAVWDRSPRNAARMQATLGIEARVVPLGYVPEMSRLQADYPQDIDVVFYGRVNKRRGSVLETLKNAGLSILVLFGAYGRERDQAIARSRLALNIHSTLPAALEMPRLGYLLANRKAVVSECAPDTEMPPDLEQACRFCPYDELAPTVLELLDDADARRKTAEAGFVAFSRQRQEGFLEPLVGRRSFVAGERCLPFVLHAGCGVDFRRDALNVDISPGVNPDLILDLSQELDFSAAHQTLRFGEIRFEPGCFERIIAHQVLEHVRDLQQTMRNFLDLLAVGGKLEISVPYDLAWGAWQDPTHVRAFNERSWHYFTEGSDYLGWRDARFALDNVCYEMHEQGLEMRSQGAPLEDILRTPRACSGMSVLLSKRLTTDEEKRQFDARNGVFYQGAVGHWRI